MRVTVFKLLLLPTKLDGIKHADLSLTIQRLSGLRRELQKNPPVLMLVELLQIRTNAQGDVHRALRKQRWKHSVFFCSKPAGDEIFHEAATFQLDNTVRKFAELLEETELLAKLSAGDMVALEAKYHQKCLRDLYHRARKHKSKEILETDEEITIMGIVFAEIVMYIEEARNYESAPVFKLADLADLYKSRMEQHGIKLNNKVNTTRLKKRLMAHIPGLKPHTKGRDVLLAFTDDIGAALTKACEWDSESDAIHLANAAKIVRRHMFEERKSFTGLKNECQRDSVPKLLLTLVNMILEGPSIKDQKEYSMSSAALSIAQLLKFNSVKHSRLEGSTKSFNVRHSTAQETPLPMYIGLVVHTHTRKRELVDRLSNAGVSISYDRVLRLSAQLGEAAIQQFNIEQVVCPSKLRGGVFTTDAVDNIDHNPSSTTSKASFHGTGISLFQHPTFPGQGVDRSIVILGGSASQKTVGNLPNYYTDIQPVQSSTIKISVPPSTLGSLCREKSNQNIRNEYCWLENVQKTIKCASDDEQNQDVGNISWAAYHASHQTTVMEVICQSALLPLFHENAHTVAMIKHSMDVVRKAVQHLNIKQTPVVVFDQPLYTIAKQIQWRWPKMYGEEKCVVMFGGLHIEMAVLKTLGDWLQGSGWVEALVQAGIATAGTANSFLHCAHVARSRHAHQVTVAALYILQNRAYNNRNTKAEDSSLGFDEWCSKREEKYPQFQYWATVMALELSLLVYVRSLRQSSFTSYIDALTELVPWFFALDHTNYARWIPVHLRDMSELPTKHPDVAR